MSSEFSSAQLSVFRVNKESKITNLEAMKHLLGPFVPPPLLLVLVSSLCLLLLGDNSKGSYTHCG